MGTACSSSKSYPGDIEADSLIQEPPPPPDFGHASRSVDPLAECHGCFRNGHCCLGFCSCMCLLLVVLFIQSMRPLSQPPADWGGPQTPVAIQEDAQKAYETNLIPAENIEKQMIYARGTSTPASLAGIFWMDYGGASSVAKDPANNYSFAGGSDGPDVLQSFGGVGLPAKYDMETKCLTLLNYGGSTAFRGGDAGIQSFKDYRERKLTTSYCFASDVQDLIEVYVKEKKGGPLAKLSGALDAGDGYMWQSPGEVETQMVKTAWGWQVITFSWRGFDPLELLPVGYFPMLMIVDGTGARTPYYEEYLAFIRSGEGGGEVNLPRPVNLEPPPVQQETFTTEA